FRAVTTLLSTGPSAIELIDRRLLDLARSAPGFARDAALVTGDPAALLVVEYAGPSEPAVLAGLAAGERALTAGGFAASWARAITAEQQAAVWRVRKAGLGLLMSMRGDWKPASGIEDAAVPPERLAEYIAEVRRVLADIGVEACFYAHASSGCIHVRPILNLKSRQGVEALKALGDATTALATALGGVISSEHGDGLARSARNEAVFGREVYALFQQVKAAFDPQGLLNPGKVVDAPDPATNLRYGPSYEANAPQARFAYPLDGDITRAIEQCNGAGVCRKLDTGAMCPSYMVTLDEEHSTRGRANALRAVIDGRLPPSALASDRLAEVMSLCVGCKACKTECPSGVDMARLRTEVLAARHAVHGAPVVSRLLANVHELERRLAPVAPAANFVASGPLWPVGARLLGIDPRRRFPSLQRETFDTWWRARTRRPSAAQVVLFADTFTTYQEPSIGRAAVAVLEAAGFEVIVPPRACCGRPALSQGLVETAVRGMKQNTAVLAPLARRGLPIIVPEPSCASALRDEAPDLLVQSSELREAARAVAAAVVTLDEFVAGLADDALRLGPGPTAALVHVHCHQRAHSGVAPSVAALRRIPGLEVHEPDAGCCGMAGGFGYRAETYAASIAMAERRLAPAVRAAARDTAIVAAGASCRQQIADTTGRSPLHPVELLARSLGRA
ncbi:MAG: FAD-binding and (Fe-S)-binding domain-containing protein, partial [Anaerolineae bacterium]